MYTLLRAGALAADLVRHPAGGQVVDVLDAALRIDAEQLAELGRAFSDDAARQHAWYRVEVHAGLRSGVEARKRGHDGWPGGGAAEAAELTEATGFGRFAELLACAREEILGWCCTHLDGVGDLAIRVDPPGVYAITDALGAGYVGPVLSPACRAVLSAPWDEIRGPLPVVAPADAYGPCSRTVRLVIDRVAMAGPVDFARLKDAYADRGFDPAGGSSSRAAAMQRAYQAAFVAARVREVAAAQFAVARAALIAGLPAPLATCGVMAALTGAMQAVALADVLDPETFGALTAAWATTLGTA